MYTLFSNLSCVSLSFYPVDSVNGQVICFLGNLWLLCKDTLYMYLLSCKKLIHPFLFHHNWQLDLMSICLACDDHWFNPLIISIGCEFIFPTIPNQYLSWTLNVFYQWLIKGCAASAGYDFWKKCLPRTSEPHHEKTGILHVQKQRHRSAKRLCFCYTDSTIFSTSYIQNFKALAIIFCCGA